MKGLFIIFEALLNETSGISKKITAQVNAFRNQGIKIELSCFKINNNGTAIGRIANNKYIDEFPIGRLRNHIGRNMKFANLLNFITSNNFDFVYIRYLHLANPYFIFFLRRLKLSGIKIILEIPTFPYDQEYIGVTIGPRMVLIIEKLSRKFFKNYVDNVVTFSNEDTIFSVPTIKISNGIDINNIKLVNGELNKATGVINMIGVASLAFWHGYDRVIKGLKDYYSNGSPGTTVIFNIVADINSTEFKKCKELVAQYKLENYVIFHGKKFGKELDAIFDIADIGAGSLGRHRSGIKYIKTLKNREYCARGIPFFYSEIDDDFENVDFILKVPADETNVNVDEIVRFLANNHFIPAKIRDYASNNLTWDKQMSKVINSINKQS